MVWLVRATTDRNPPTSGGGGCQHENSPFVPFVENTMRLYFEKCNTFFKYFFHPFSNRCNAFQLLSFFTFFLWM